MNHEDINPHNQLAGLFPWHLRNRLVLAARARDYDEIDAITDTLANLGLVRPRRDGSMFSPKLTRALQLKETTQ
jgi:hypothetical protein